MKGLVILAALACIPATAFGQNTNPTTPATPAELQFAIPQFVTTRATGRVYLGCYVCTGTGRSRWCYQIPPQLGTESECNALHRELNPNLVVVDPPVSPIYDDGNRDGNIGVVVPMNPERLQIDPSRLVSALPVVVPLNPQPPAVPVTPGVFPTPPIPDPSTIILRPAPVVQQPSSALPVVIPINPQPPEVSVAPGVFPTPPLPAPGYVSPPAITTPTPQPSSALPPIFIPVQTTPVVPTPTPSSALPPLVPSVVPQ